MGTILDKDSRGILIEKLDDRQEIALLEDGFYYYFPKGFGGISAENLRNIADELDSRNKERKRDLDKYFRKINRQKEFAFMSEDNEVT